MPSVEKLLAQLRDEDPKQRRQAAFALGTMQNPLVVPELLEAADDPDDGVRSFVASSLARMGTTALDELRGNISHTSPHVRQVVALALHHMNDPQVVADLIPLLDDPSSIVKQAAAAALRHYATAEAQLALDRSGEAED